MLAPFLKKYFSILGNMIICLLAKNERINPTLVFLLGVLLGFRVRYVFEFQLAKNVFAFLMNVVEGYLINFSLVLLLLI